MNRRLLVDLEALAANYRIFAAAAAADASAEPSDLRNFPGLPAIGSVVKANAYGIGARAAFERLVEEGCRSFFVATLEEAHELSEVAGLVDAEGIEIFIFDGVNADTAAEIAGAGLIPVLNDESQVSVWRAQADAPAALHFDTGMHRLGLPRALNPDQFAALNVVLVMTHLVCGDEPEHPMNGQQMAAFAEIVARFPGVRTSIGNSAGWLNGIQGDLARPGIGLYGGNPFSDRPNPMQPVAALQGRVLQIHHIRPGESVGYSASWVAEKETRVAAIGLGYADGLPRHLSGVGEMALANGRRCPIVGRVSMDTTMIDIGDTPEVGLGDWVECFGANLDVDEVADRAGTLGYELLTRVGVRVPRVLGPLR